MIRRSIRAVTAALVIIVVIAAAPHAVQKRSPLDGTWDYAPAGFHGWSMFQDGRYVAFYSRPDSVPPRGALSDSARAMIYRTAYLDAGTFAVADTLVTCQRLYSKDPRQMPVTWRWSFTMKGDTIYYHVLNAQGRSTGREFRSVRLHTP